MAGKRSEVVDQQAQQGVELTVKDIWREFAKIVIGLPRPSRGVGIFGGKIWYQMDRESKVGSWSSVVWSSTRWSRSAMWSKLW